MRKVLTDSFCRTVKPPEDGRAEWADLRCSGLEFRVTPKGVRSWSFRFRDPSSRRTLRASIGPYPDISLSDARQKADDLRRQAMSGVNPIEQRRQDRRDATTKTYKALADRYLNEHAKRHKRPRSAEEDERNLRVHILPKWGKRDFRKLRRADVVELIESIVSDGKPTAANRVQALISKIFSFAMDADLLDANPAARLRKRGAEESGTRVLTDDELRAFWRKIVLPPVSRRVGLALRLILLTGARANEVAGLRRDELLRLDEPATATWILPAERSKNKREHLIPLSPSAVAVIRDALSLVDDADPLVFPSPTKESRSLTRHALPVAMARFCDELVGDDSASKTMRADPPSPHDLRRTFGTRLSSLGIVREDRDACLNHTRTDVGRHYDLYEREREKRAACSIWSNALENILSKSS